MWLKSVKLFILLTVMLNHAVMACDALVVHMPEHEHSYTSYIYDAHAASSQHSTQTADSDADADADEHHSAHAHVTCAISYIHNVKPIAVGASRSLALQPALSPLSYSPPVPPPNA
ncbi:cobalt transporter [Rheinheimera muenzenbergensis]|uniref:Cobalt transporter n=1 Tax=Rheinheimera muenzenbergensis TaxID=1193628 RepID=A0ABU8CBC8_9GAMM